jgi:DNA polymerase-3 subunit chi
MLQVDFHFNAPEKGLYVCRLLRKISSQGKRTGVCGSEQDLQALYLSLWHLNPTDFVTHSWLNDGDIVVSRSSIVLSTDWSAIFNCANLNVGLNLNAEPPPDLGGISRLVEVVGPDETDKASARLRWKHYTQLGFTINRYDLSAQTV